MMLKPARYTIAFYGVSHAAQHLKMGARFRGLKVVDDPAQADVLFVSEDTPTDEFGFRNTDPIKALLEVALTEAADQRQVVLTSQVPPGFCAQFCVSNLFHQAETLRIIDAEERAMNPEQIIVGGAGEIGPAYLEYLLAFECPILRMSWEDAEFTKIAINMMLAQQVEATNRLSEAAAKVGADWEQVARALRNDKRIGKYAYLTPGRWQDSLHLLRDARTLEEICTPSNS